MKHFKFIFLSILVLAPAFAFAQFSDTTQLINAFGGILNSLIVILIALALFVFLWGLVKFIFRVGGDEKAVAEGKRVMIWGLIALFIMVSVWGIIELVQDDLGLSNSGFSSGNGSFSGPGGSGSSGGTGGSFSGSSGGGNTSDCTGAAFWMGNC